MTNKQTSNKKLLLTGGAFLILTVSIFGLFKNKERFVESLPYTDSKRIKTTSAPIAVGNLNSQIATAKMILESRPNDLEYISRLMDLTLTKTVFLGNYSDFKLLEQYVKPQSELENQIDLNIDFYMATHQFEKVEEQIDKFSSISENKSKLKSFQISLDLARGKDLKKAENQQKEVLAEQPSFSNYIKMSAIQSELGEFTNADQSLKRALKKYSGSSPFPFALVYFQRGVLWGEKIGDSKKAKKFYETAVDYLPQYSSAQVHLAEILFEEGDSTEALASLENVISNGDPEPKGLKYEVLKSLKKSDLAAPNLQLAQSEYQVLLSEFKDAFSDHGAEFYMGPAHQPARAAELALNNLSNRKTQRSYRLAIEALDLAKDTKKMCDVLKEAKSRIVINHAPLVEVVKNFEDQCSR